MGMTSTATRNTCSSMRSWVPWNIRIGQAKSGDLALGILAFLLSVAFAPVYSGAITPRWAVIAIGAPIALSFLKPNKLTVLHATGLALLAWAALSLAWTSNRLDGLGELLQWLFLAQVFVLGARAQSLRPVWIGLALGLGVSSLIGILQISGW